MQEKRMRAESAKQVAIATSGRRVRKLSLHSQIGLFAGIEFANPRG